MTLGSKKQGAAKLMPLHKRIATGNAPIKKPAKVVKKK